MAITLEEILIPKDLFAGHVILTQVNLKVL